LHNIAIFKDDLLRVGSLDAENVELFEDFVEKVGDFLEP
jgi:hypothetical protein